MRSYHSAPLINHATIYPPETIINLLLLDLIWINFVGENCVSGCLFQDETDHCPIFLNEKKNKYTNELSTKFRFRDYLSENMDTIRDKLNDTGWDFELFGIVTEKSKCFLKYHQQCFYSSFPIEI